MRKRETSGPHPSSAKDFAMCMEPHESITDHIKTLCVEMVTMNKVAKIEQIPDSFHHHGRNETFDSG